MAQTARGVLLDTSVLIAHLRGTLNVNEFKRVPNLNVIAPAE